MSMIFHDVSLYYYLRHYIYEIWRAYQRAKTVCLRQIISWIYDLEIFDKRIMVACRTRTWGVAVIAAGSLTPGIAKLSPS
jgi:hypothetical protein